MVETTEHRGSEQTINSRCDGGKEHFSQNSRPPPSPGPIHLILDNSSLSEAGWLFLLRCRKTHPGPVIHLSDNPLDASKLLIGFETGQVVLWDLRTRTAEMRCQSAEPMRSISWHHEGKQFMCSHTDGSLTTWTVRQAPKPVNLTLPHGESTQVYAILRTR
uniref:Uncharacterized protein n=1 Tax=Timema cristinae TaxID=61476 RepID=A0A7R9CEA7_TIMCR|nr:unnamed protein product [Timema cristinae]